MKKILFFNQRWTSGGIERIITEIIEYSRKFNKNFEFVILVSQKETNVFDEVLKNNDVDFIVLNKKKRSNPLIRNIVSLKKYCHYLKIIKPDIIHVNVYNAIGNIYALLSSIIKKNKIIIHAHNNGFDDDKFKIKLIINKISKILCTNSDNKTYIACSKQAADFCFTQKNKALIISNGIPLEKFEFDSKKREEYRKSMKLENEFAICNIGRMVEQKNQIRLIKIFSEIKKQNNNAKLYIIGDGKLYLSIIKKIKEKCLENDVIIYQKISGIEKFLQAMDCFLFPSIYEGFGLVAVEAQVSGLPTFINSKLSKEIFNSPNAYPIDLSATDFEIAKFIIDKTNASVRKSYLNSTYDINKMMEKIIDCYK